MVRGWYYPTLFQSRQVVLLAEVQARSFARMAPAAAPTAFRGHAPVTQDCTALCSDFSRPIH